MPSPASIAKKSPSERRPRPGPGGSAQAAVSAKAKNPKPDPKPALDHVSVTSSPAGSVGVAVAGDDGGGVTEAVATDDATVSPVRRRLRTKTLVDDSPVVVILRRMATAGEEAALGLPETGGQEDAATAEATEAELEALEKQEGAADDLDGDQKDGGRRKGRGRSKAGGGDAEAADDDQLFDQDDDLEGEEDIGDISEEEVLEDEEDDGDIVDEAWQPIGSLPWPDVWFCADGNPPQPGTQGFNAYAAERISRAGLGKSNSPFAGLGMRLHQESAAFLLHPKSPITRLLVDHATGTGKTLIMLRILDNYFDDPRPKVAIFPKDRVCDNFYQELLKWPTRWREFFSFSRPNMAALASGASNWKRRRTEVWDMNNERLRQEARTRGMRLEKVMGEVIDSIREVLEMKNAIRKGKVRSNVAKKFMKEHPGAAVPRAPLRAFRYTTAGGGACELGADGWPRSPILKVGFDHKELNSYSGKVVIMDECHNLVRPSTKYEEQLGRLRDHLVGARNTVLAGFTGTPVGNDAQEGRILLDVVKGTACAHCCDEGFVSSFQARSSTDFCREVPVKGIPDGVIHEGMFEDLMKRHSLHGEALKRYLLKEVDFQTIPRLMRMPEEKRVARLGNYCNLHVHYGSCWGKQKESLFKDVKDHAPKMYAVAKSIAKHKEKAVVLLTREMGFKTMVEVLRRTGKKQGFKVATLEELGDFNDARRNLRGERFRVLCAETSQAGEGVQFKHVRRIYLVDVPLRHSELVQRTSRCVRLGGHGDLPEEERELAVEAHIACMPKMLRQGPSSFIYRELLNAKEVALTPGCALEAATKACMEELAGRGVKNLHDMQRVLQADDGEGLIDLLTETALEQLGDTSSLPARPLAMALWRLRRGGDDLELLEKALISEKTVKTADEVLMDYLVDKSAELLPPLEAMRLGAVDRQLLAPLGDPPCAPPPRSEAVKLRSKKALAKLKADVQEAAPAAEAPEVSGAGGGGNEEEDDEEDEIDDDEEDEQLGMAELEAELDAEPDAQDEDDGGEEEEEEECGADEEAHEAAADMAAMTAADDDDGGEGEEAEEDSEEVEDAPVAADAYFVD